MDIPKCQLRHVHGSSCFDWSSFIQQDSSKLCLPKCQLRHVHGSSCFNMSLCTEQDSFTDDLNKLDLPRCGLLHIHDSFCFDSLNESDLEWNTYMFNKSHQDHEASIWNDSHQFHNASLWNDSHQVHEDSIWNVSHKVNETSIWNESHKVNETSIWNESHKVNETSVWNESHQINDTKMTIWNESHQVHETKSTIWNESCQVHETSQVPIHQPPSLTSCVLQVLDKAGYLDFNIQDPCSLEEALTRIGANDQVPVHEASMEQKFAQKRVSFCLPEDDDIGFDISDTESMSSQTNKYGPTFSLRDLMKQALTSLRP